MSFPSPFCPSSPLPRPGKGWNFWYLTRQHKYIITAHATGAPPPPSRDTDVDVCFPTRGCPQRPDGTFPTCPCVPFGRDLEKGFIRASRVRVCRDASFRRASKWRKKARFTSQIARHLHFACVPRYTFPSCSKCLRLAGIASSTRGKLRERISLRMI